MKPPHSRLQYLSRFLPALAACAFAALFPSLPVSAFPTSNQTPWLPIGMGGNGFTDDFDLMNAPASAKARYFLAAGVDSGGAWISFDEGASFVPVGGASFSGTAGVSKPNANVIKFVRADTTGRTILVGTDSKRMFRSTVSPTTGELILEPVVSPNGLPNDGFFDQPISVIQAAPSNAQIMYAGGGTRRVYIKGKIGISESQPAMWTSTDAGQHWSTMTPIVFTGLHGTVCNIAVQPNDPNIVFAATDQGLYKFSSGAWVRLGAGTGSGQLPHRAVFGICCDPASVDGQVLYCTMMPYDDMEYFLFNDKVPSGETFNRTGIYKSTNGGTTWTQLSVGFTPPGGGGFAVTGFFYQVQVSAGDSSRVYATYGAKNPWEHGILRSLDAGLSWTLVPENDTAHVILDYQTTFKPALLGLYSESATNDHVFVTGDVATNYKSTDPTLLFKSFTSSVSPEGAFRGWGLEGGRGKYFSVSAADPNTMFYADNDRGFWRSTNGGTDWAKGYDPENATQGKGRLIVPDPDNAQVVYATSAFRIIDYAGPNHGVPHFFKNTDGTAFFSETVPGPMNSFDNAIEDNFWDLALDPTPLPAADVATKRTLYLAGGSKAQYHFDVVLDTIADVAGKRHYKVYMDGVLVTATAFEFENSAATDITKVEVAIPGGGAAATKFFVDNVGAYQSYQDQDLPITLVTFENDQSGDSPSGWAVSGSGTALVDQIPHVSPQVLRLSTATSNQNVTAGRTIDGPPVHGSDVLVRFDVILDDTTTTKRVVIYGGGTNKAASIIFVNGKVKATNGALTPIIVDVIENRYAHRGIYKSTDGGDIWNDISQGLPGGSYLSHVRVDPNVWTTLYCSDERANGGLYRKVDTSNWAKIFPTASFARVAGIAAISRSGATHLYACVIGTNVGTAAGIWKSVNGGTTWTQLLDPATNTTLFPNGLPADLTFSHVEPGTGDEVLVASSYGVLRSTDAGASWAWFNESIPNTSTEFVRTVTVDSVQRHYVGMRTDGYGVRYTMPANLSFKRKSGSVWVNDWRNIPTLARVGGQAYIDAAWKLDTLPAAGPLWLLTTSFEDRLSTATELLQLQPAVAADVYVTVPHNAAPGWLSTNGFTKLSGSISMTERGATSSISLDVWKKTISANTILTLGGLKNSPNTTTARNYLVFVKLN